MAKSSNTTDAPTLPEAPIITQATTSIDSASNSFSSSCSSSNSSSSACSSSSSYYSSSEPSSSSSQSSSSDSNILLDKSIGKFWKSKITSVVLDDSYTQLQVNGILRNLGDKVITLTINRKLTYSVVDTLSSSLLTASPIDTLILNEGFDEPHPKTLELAIHMLCSTLEISSVKNLILANNEHNQQIAKILASSTGTPGINVSFLNEPTFFTDLSLDGQKYNFDVSMVINPDHCHNNNLPSIPPLDLSFLLPLDLSLPYSDNSSSSSTETSILGNDASSSCSSTSSGNSSSS